MDKKPITLKELRQLIKKSLGQGGPLSNPTKCVAVERITSEGIFVIKRDFDEQREDYEADYAFLLREANKIYEANKDLLSVPPIETDCIRGEQRLDGWCLESLEKLDSTKTTKQKTKFRRKRGKVKGLTPREKQIADWITKDKLSTSEIASKTNTSIRNIEKHIKEIDEKLKSMRSSRCIDFSKVQRYPTDKKGQVSISTKDPEPDFDL